MVQKRVKAAKLHIYYEVGGQDMRITGWGDGTVEYEWWTSTTLTKRGRLQQRGRREQMEAEAMVMLMTQEMVE
jgi:hypothetical protein